MQTFSQKTWPKVVKNLNRWLTVRNG